MSIQYRIGDVFARLAEIPGGSIDLIVTSPPFLALRSYLPADHEHKHREIGSEATPADFLDTLLALTAEWGRVLAPHGSICVELGDTYSGSGGAGGDYNSGGLRDGQGKADGSARRARGGLTEKELATDTGDRKWRRHEGRTEFERQHPIGFGAGRSTGGGAGWPLAKSLTGIPTLYPWSLAYGRNLLTGQDSPAGRWRIRNVIVWARPNPPVGALGDKFRPATSYITVACQGPRRYFDLDAVREPGSSFNRADETKGHLRSADAHADQVGSAWMDGRELTHHPAGAPPLDWHADDHPEDGDWLWKLSTQPYRGSHYATFPLELPRRLTLAMCPQRVCTVCGKPSERITATERIVDGTIVASGSPAFQPGRASTGGGEYGNGASYGTNVTTLGWSDCGHEAWRPGVVLDPFAGSGTTLEAAQLVGRHAIGIDLDSRNADLARDRVGMFLTVDGAA
jgi:hypothetical protein